MNINKEHSPTWVKVTIWVTIIAFVFAFIAVGFFEVVSGLKNNSNSTSSSSTQSSSTSGSDQISTINAQYQSIATSTEALVKQEPDNKDQVISLASTYMQWGTALMQLTSTDAQTAALEKLNLAKKYWAKAYELDPSNKEVGGDYATALYYTGEEDKAIEIAEKVLKANPKYSTVWYNLGIFYANKDKDKSIAALEKAIKYETDSTARKSAQDMLKQVKGSN